MCKSGKRGKAWNDSWWFYIITSVLFAFVGIALGQFTVGFLISVVLKLISGVYPTLNDEIIKVITGNFSFVVALLLLAVYAHKREKKNLCALWCQGEHKVRETLLGAMIGFLLCAAAICGVVFLGGWELVFYSADGVVVVLVLLSGVVQATAEEILFRGYLLSGLRKRYSVGFAVIASGLVFSVTHVLNPGITVLAIINITVIGIALSYIAVRRNSIFLVTGIHIMWNFTEEVIFGTPNSGIVFPKSIFKLVGGESSLFYNQRFGVEAAIQTLLLWALLFVVFMKIKNKKEQ